MRKGACWIFYRFEEQMLPELCCGLLHFYSNLRPRCLIWIIPWNLSALAASFLIQTLPLCNLHFFGLFWRRLGTFWPEKASAITKKNKKKKKERQIYGAFQPKLCLSATTDGRSGSPFLCAVRMLSWQHIMKKRILEMTECRGVSDLPSWWSLWTGHVTFLCFIWKVRTFWVDLWYTPETHTTKKLWSWWLLYCNCNNMWSPTFMPALQDICYLPWNANYWMVWDSF